METAASVGIDMAAVNVMQISFWEKKHLSTAAACLIRDESGPKGHRRACGDRFERLITTFAQANLSLQQSGEVYA
jgi:hypothetical protein